MVQSILLKRLQNEGIENYTDIRPSTSGSTTKDHESFNENGNSSISLLDDSGFADESGSDNDDPSVNANGRTKNSTAAGETDHPNNSPTRQNNEEDLEMRERNPEVQQEIQPQVENNHLPEVIMRQEQPVQLAADPIPNPNRPRYITRLNYLQVNYRNRLEECLSARYLPQSPGRERKYYQEDGRVRIIKFIFCLPKYVHIYETSLFIISDFQVYLGDGKYVDGDMFNYNFNNPKIEPRSFFCAVLDAMWGETIVFRRLCPARAVINEEIVPFTPRKLQCVFCKN